MSAMIKFATIDINKCNNKLNSTQIMLTILNVSELSGDYETLKIEGAMIQEQVAKTTRNSHPTCSTLSIYPLLEKNIQELLEKELNKTINAAKDNSTNILRFENKDKDTNKNVATTTLIPKIKMDELFQNNWFPVRHISNCLERITIPEKKQDIESSQSFTNTLRR